jgi:hypothetical protein
MLASTAAAVEVHGDTYGARFVWPRTSVRFRATPSHLRQLRGNRDALRRPQHGHTRSQHRRLSQLGGDSPPWRFEGSGVVVENPQSPGFAVTQCPVFGDPDFVTTGRAGGQQRRDMVPIG